MKWSSCNLGATRSSESGNFYAWGETTTKESYTFDNYKWGQRGGVWGKLFTKYLNEPNYGAIDNLTRVESADDPAATLLGGSWRMPDEEEVNELVGNCIWIKMELDGIPGFMVASQTNRNAIFIPVSGWIEKTDEQNFGSAAKLWSSTLGVGSGPGNAQGKVIELSFGAERTERLPDPIGTHTYTPVNKGCGASNRENGLNIRPVTL